jgi:hypothetical protein
VTPQTKRRFNNPPLAFRRKPPLNSPVVKSLFGKRLPLNMSTSQTSTTNPVNNQRQWSSTLFKLFAPNSPLGEQIKGAYCWVCVIFFACVCVGASDTTTASDGLFWAVFAIFSGFCYF